MIRQAASESRRGCNTSIAVDRKDSGRSKDELRQRNAASAILALSRILAVSYRHRASLLSCLG